MSILPQLEKVVLNRSMLNLTDAVNNIDAVYVHSADSTASTTAVNGPDLVLVGSYWSSSAVDRSLILRHTVTDDPYSELTVLAGAVGSESEIFSVNENTGTALTGNVSVDGVLILSPNSGYGRISTVSVAGAAIDVDASCTDPRLNELRYTISDWSAGNTMDGAYIRLQSDVDNASGVVQGIEAYGVANASGALGLKGVLSYAYAKGDSTDTVGTAWGLHGEFSMDAGRSNTLTLTTAAAGVFSRITCGKVDDYTKVHAYVAWMGDMDGGARKFGSGLRVLDGPESGTCTLSNVLYTDMAADYFLQVSAADIGGVDDTIAGQTVGTINALVKCKFASTDFYLYGYDAGPSV